MRPNPNQMGRASVIGGQPSPNSASKMQVGGRLGIRGFFPRGKGIISPFPMSASACLMGLFGSVPAVYLAQI